MMHPPGVPNTLAASIFYHAFRKRLAHLMAAGLPEKSGCLNSRLQTEGCLALRAGAFAINTPGRTLLTLVSPKTRLVNAQVNLDKKEYAAAATQVCTTDQQMHLTA